MSFQSTSFSSGSYLHAVEASTSPEAVVSALDEMGQPIMQLASFGSKGKQLASSRRAAAQQSKGKINALATASLGILEAMETHLATTGEHERREAFLKSAERTKYMSTSLRAGATVGERETQKVRDLRGKLHEASFIQRVATKEPSTQYVNVVHPASRSMRWLALTGILRKISKDRYLSLS